MDKALRLLRGVDHLGEQEAVTLHRRVNPACSGSFGVPREYVASATGAAPA
jgi:hypothetical protein